MRNTDKKKENMVLMSMRISAEDKEEIEAKARKTGLSTSEYIRRCALGRKLPCYGDTSLLKEYSMQLGKIGSNLNQIAKHLNGGGDFYSIYYDSNYRTGNRYGCKCSRNRFNPRQRYSD